MKPIQVEAALWGTMESTVTAVAIVAGLLLMFWPRVRWWLWGWRVRRAWRSAPAAVRVDSWDTRWPDGKVIILLAAGLLLAGGAAAQQKPPQVPRKTEPEAVAVKPEEKPAPKPDEKPETVAPSPDFLKGMDRLDAMATLRADLQNTARGLQEATDLLGRQMDALIRQLQPLVPEGYDWDPATRSFKLPPKPAAPAPPAAPAKKEGTP